jgi:enediyne biosynthesis protein E4
MSTIEIPAVRTQGQPARMKSVNSHLFIKLAVLMPIVFCYWLARPPGFEAADRDQLASRFRFSHATLPGLPGDTSRTVRDVHPSLEHIAAWISSVGASVALHDLDGDGLPNDVCYVETRTDRVIVAPVPGTSERFEPFALDPAPLAFDPGTMAPMGCLPGDLNEDGLADVLVYYWGRPPIAFLRKSRDASSHSYLSGETYERVEVAPGAGRWFTNAATLADVDGDGHADLIVGNYFPDDSRVLDARAAGSSPMQHSMSRADNGGHKHFLMWNGASAGADPSVRFVEAKGAIDGSADLGWTLAIAAADLDGDLLPEIYLANDFGTDRLLHNRSTPGHPRFALLEGRKTATTPSSKVLGRDSFKGMGADFGDLDGDGRLDIFVSNIASEFALLESHFAFINTGEIGLMRQGIAPFVDRSEPLGLSRSDWAWEARLADFDNDGDLEALQALGFARGTVNRWPELQELAMGNDEFLSDPKCWPRFAPGDDLSGHPINPFFVRDATGRFRDIAKDLGLGEPGVSRGIATADVDGDGRLDYAVANQWAASTFHRNQSPDAGSFLGLHLLLPLHSGEADRPTSRPGHPAPGFSGRPAIGASATVLTPSGRRLVGQVDGGNGHSGKRSPDLHFGLGSMSDDAKLRVELAWRDPDGKVHRQELTVSPGWHTVRLGWPGTNAIAKTEAE